MKAESLVKADTAVGLPVIELQLCAGTVEMKLERWSGR
jgi:hypothetical protein